jgi:hypothetical protein
VDVGRQFGFGAGEREYHRFDDLIGKVIERPGDIALADFDFPRNAMKQVTVLDAHYRQRAIPIR